VAAVAAAANNKPASQKGCKNRNTILGPASHELKTPIIPINAAFAKLIASGAVEKCAMFICAAGNPAYEQMFRMLV
jgi:hypothetical protein